MSLYFRFERRPDRPAYAEALFDAGITVVALVVATLAVHRFHLLGLARHIPVGYLALVLGILGLLLLVRAVNQGVEARRESARLCGEETER